MAEMIPELVFDHHSQEFAQDPRGVAAELREAGATYSPEYGGFYVLSRHAYVREATLNPDLFPSGRDADDPIHRGVLIPAGANGMLSIPSESDGEVHRGYRRAMAPYFTAKAAEPWRTRIEHWITVATDQVIESGRIDLVKDLASPVTFLFACEFLGIPLEDWRKWQKPAHVIMFAEPDSPEMLEAHAGWADNNAQLNAIVEARRVEPADDFISQIARAEVDGEFLATPIAAGLCRAIMTGSVDTTGALATHSLRYLAEHPEAHDRLLADAKLMESAVDEFLRYFTPNHAMARTVARDTEFHGCPLHAGDRVLLSWLGANHDPDVFDHPEEVRLDRSPNPHASFGFGVHKCIGLHIARLETALFIAEVLRRMPDFRILDEEVVRFPNIGIADGFLSMPASFTPGPRVTTESLPG